MKYSTAIIYTMIAIYILFDWMSMLSPFDMVLGQLHFIFSPYYDRRMYFLFYALAAILTIQQAAVCWLWDTNSKKHTRCLRYISFILFAISTYFFSLNLTIGFGAGALLIAFRQCTSYCNISPKNRGKLKNNGEQGDQEDYQSDS